VADLCALTSRGIAEKGWCEWRSIPLQLLGVNGNSTHAIKALAGALAVDAGLGKGEFSAYLNNMRSIVHVLGALAMGNWYACFQESPRFLKPGSVWFFAGLMGGILPTLLAWTLETSFAHTAILVRAALAQTLFQMAEPSRTGFYRNPNLKITQ
jgi:hypothetical protein